jgi:hypothetical protein
MTAAHIEIEDSGRDDNTKMSMDDMDSIDDVDNDGMLTLLLLLQNNKIQMLQTTINKYTNVEINLYSDLLMDDSQSGLYRAGGRADKSLGILTQRFLDMLQDAPDGLADLNIVCLLS